MPQFDNAYYQQLPGFYTALNPTPLKDARLLYHSERWRASWGWMKAGLLRIKPRFGREKRCCRACSRWRRCTVATSSACGQGSWVMAAAFCLANRFWRTAATATGT